MFTYYIRAGLFDDVSEIIAWSYKRNDSLIDFESRVSGYYRSRITDSPKYTKEQILQMEIRKLGEVRTVKSNITPRTVWEMISDGRQQELYGMLRI